jgi:hypothetical protein
VSQQNIFCSITFVFFCSLSGEIITQFEDLSNEVIYEIFEFLDHFHVYEAFFNLTLRFRRLLTHSTLPMKINLSPMSKSTLQRYCQDILLHNQHRIYLLRLSNLFMYDDRAFSLFRITSNFCRLETVIFDNIESDYLDHFLHQLTSLSSLSSLTITTADNVEDKIHIYREIFRLPALKYCKLSLGERIGSNLLSFATNEYSPIEHFIIENGIHIDQLDSLLSYVPRLRRLSLH